MPSAKPLEGKRIAVLAADLYEDLELWYPLLRLREEGASRDGGARAGQDPVPASTGTWSRWIRR